MRRQIIIEGNIVVVAAPADLLELSLTISKMATYYNAFVEDDKQVAKFVDKATGAKRLFAVLPEYADQERSVMLRRHNGSVPRNPGDRRGRRTEPKGSGRPFETG